MDNRYNLKPLENCHIDLPVMHVQLIDADKIIANDYNPNHVAPPELKLLEISILEDGMTQPCVVYHDKADDIYVIVDGFHRYELMKFRFQQKQIPCVVIDKDISERIESTIRHNRARGSHRIKDMSNIVLMLVQNGLSDEEIGRNLGMQPEEVFRLKQITGLREAFANHEFSKSWDELIKKIQ